MLLHRGDDELIWQREVFFIEAAAQRCWIFDEIDDFLKQGVVFLVMFVGTVENGSDLRKDHFFSARLADDDVFLFHGFKISCGILDLYGFVAEGAVSAGGAASFEHADGKWYDLGVKEGNDPADRTQIAQIEAAPAHALRKFHVEDESWHDFCEDLLRWAAFFLTFAENVFTVLHFLGVDVCFGEAVGAQKAFQWLGDLPVLVSGLHRWALDFFGKIFLKIGQPLYVKHETTWGGVGFERIVGQANGFKKRLRVFLEITDGAIHVGSRHFFHANF